MLGIAKLLDDAVLIRVEKPERMSAAKTLWIPDSAKRQPHEMYQGTVILVGPGRIIPPLKIPPVPVMFTCFGSDPYEPHPHNKIKECPRCKEHFRAGAGHQCSPGRRSPMEVQVGDRVLVYWSSMEHDITARYKDGDEYRIVSERGIQAVVQ